MSFWQNLLRPRYRLADLKQRERAKSDFLQVFGFARVPPDNQSLRDTEMEWREQDDDWFLMVEHVTDDMKRQFPFLRRQSRPKPSKSTTKSAVKSRPSPAKPPPPSTPRSAPTTVPKNLPRVELNLQGSLVCPHCCNYISSGSGEPGIWRCPHCRKPFEATAYSR